VLEILSNSGRQFPSFKAVETDVDNCIWQAVCEISSLVAKSDQFFPLLVVI